MRTVSQAFDVFLERLTPLASQREAASRHRASVEASIKTAMGTYFFVETGSFHHGTGIRNYSDVDLMVCLQGDRPSSSDTALGWIKSALSASFPHTPVRISRPAVVVQFATKSETWEVIPGFLTSRGGPNVFVYDIPGPSNGWIDTAPQSHLKYVDSCNESGGAKQLARLAKAWKYFNQVPVSSFYLEMRAAQHAKEHPPFVPVYDVSGLFDSLHSHQLVAMNDPSDASGRFEACSSQPKRQEALSRLATAKVRARNALDAYGAKKEGDAFYYLDLLFAQKFPSQYE